MTTDTSKPAFENLAYGPHARHRLDLWLAPGRPSPLVMHVHGGGWMKGDKVDIRNDRMLPRYLEAGFSVASISYRYTDDTPAPGQMLDTARAVQYVRLHAPEWGIDPGRITLTGGSAGGVNILWVAFHDDLAAPDDPDPIARQSTRVAGVFAVNTPTFFDLRSIEGKIPGHPERHPAMVPLLGLGPNGYNDPRAEGILRSISPLYLATAAAPPICLWYGRRDVELAKPDPGYAIHHPRFGAILKRRLDELGVPCIYRCRDHYPDLDDQQINDRLVEDRIELMSALLSPKRPPVPVTARHSSPTDAPAAPRA